jgi:CII-binding regulator of phage lambda lysogenization HflD
MEKFERAILAMNKGLQKQRFSELPKDELLKKEISFIETRLEKLGIKDETLVNSIVEKLYKSNIKPDKPAIQIQS